MPLGELDEPHPIVVANTADTAKLTAIRLPLPILSFPWRSRSPRDIQPSGLLRFVMARGRKMHGNRDACSASSIDLPAEPLARLGALQPDRKPLATGAPKTPFFVGVTDEVPIHAPRRVEVVLAAARDVDRQEGDWIPTISLVENLADRKFAGELMCAGVPRKGLMVKRRPAPTPVRREVRHDFRAVEPRSSQPTSAAGLFGPEDVGAIDGDSAGPDQTTDERGFDVLAVAVRTPDVRAKAPPVDVPFVNRDAAGGNRAFDPGAVDRAIFIRETDANRVFDWTGPIQKRTPDRYSAWLLHARAEPLDNSGSVKTGPTDRVARRVGPEDVPCVDRHSAWFLRSGDESEFRFGAVKVRAANLISGLIGPVDVGGVDSHPAGLADLEGVEHTDVFGVEVAPVEVGAGDRIATAPIDRSMRSRRNPWQQETDCRNH